MYEEFDEIQEPEPEASPPPPTRRDKWRARGRRLRARIKSLAPVVVGVIIAYIALFAFNTLNPGPPRLTQDDVKSTVAQAMASATAPPALAARVYQVIQPSLVEVDTRILTSDGKEEGGRGAGVVLDERGSVLTSLHVVSNALEIVVTFADGSQSPAIIAAKQPENDIALLTSQSPPLGLIPATLGDPRSLNVGDETFAVGNPFGLTSSLTAGAISGLNREFKPENTDKPMTGMIQFDAAVNPGNSGGPLLNRYGEVVGIVTGLLNPTEQNVFIGIGFAVPINVAAAAAGTPPY